MIVLVTVPIKVEGHFLAEFDAAVEIKPISGRGYELEEMFVDVGGYVKSRVNGRGRWISQFVKVPGTLSGYIQDYLETSECQIFIEEQMQENHR